MEDRYLERCMGMAALLYGCSEMNRIGSEMRATPKRPKVVRNKREQKICKSCKLFGTSSCHSNTRAEPKHTICDDYNPKRK